MGILRRADRPTVGDRVESAISAAYGSAPLADPSTMPISTPWSSGNMAQVFYDDVFGEQAPVNTRSSAMRIPTIARARNLIVASCTRFRFVEKRGDQVVESPPWFTATGTGASYQQRLVWTVDDLMFYGWSCWERTPAADTRFPLTASRVPVGSWAVNPDNRIEINGVVKDDHEVLLIPGLHEGILNFGADVLDDARTLMRNVRKRLATPIPGLDLHQTGGRELTETEIDDLIDRWAKARRGENAGVSYTSKDIEAKAMAGDDGALMIDARNAMAVDLARLVGVTAGLVDATAPKASLNYETTQGRNEEFFDRDLAQYLLPIVWRLSMDDVTPRGQHVSYDLSDFLAPVTPPTGPALED